MSLNLLILEIFSFFKFLSIWKNIFITYKILSYTLPNKGIIINPLINITPIQTHDKVELKFNLLEIASTSLAL